MSEPSPASISTRHPVAKRLVLGSVRPSKERSEFVERRLEGEAGVVVLAARRDALILLRVEELGEDEGGDGEEDEAEELVVDAEDEAGAVAVEALVNLRGGKGGGGAVSGFASRLIFWRSAETDCPYGAIGDDDTGPSSEVGIARSGLGLRGSAHAPRRGRGGSARRGR